MHHQVKGVLEYYDDVTGTVKAVPLKESAWHHCYRSGPSLTENFYVRFRNKFHHPYQEFLSMLEQAEENFLLPSCYGGKDMCAQEGAPVLLLMLWECFVT